MKLLPLSGGRLHSTVDDDVFRWASLVKWSVGKSGHNQYACRKLKRKNQYLHREVLGPRPGFEVDHIDGDGLNNQRENLREVSHAGNARACRKRNLFSRSSRFRGVRLRHHLTARPWEAQIRVNQRCKFLGLHATEEQAARAYDKAAQSFFGSVAQLNFPSL